MDTHAAVAENTAEPLKIIDLRTECLCEIFKYLKYTDLLSVQKSHAAFGAAIEGVVSTSNFSFIIRRIDGKCLKELRDIENFLKMFGKQIKRLTIELTSYDSAAHNLLCYQFERFIANYCVGGSVKHCVFINFHLRKSFLKELSSFFKSLETLELRSEMLERYSYWFWQYFTNDANDANLKALKIIGDNCHVGPVGLSDIVVSKLETCVLHVPGSFTRSTTNVLLPVNFTLRHLDLGDMHTFDMDELVAFQSVETLNFCMCSNYTPGSLQRILYLRNLKELRFVYKSLDFFKVSSFLAKLADRNQLQSLTLDDTRYARVEYNSDDEDDENEDDGEEDFMMSDADAESNHDNDNSFNLNDDNENNVESDADTNDGDVNNSPAFAVEAQLAQILGQMTTLTELTLKSVFTFKQHLPQIGRDLANLRKFTFTSMVKSYGFETKQMIDSLLQFVREAKQLVSLNVKLSTPNTAEFYRKLVKIRKEQQSKQILHVIDNQKHPVPTTIDGKYVKGKVIACWLKECISLLI